MRVALARAPTQRGIAYTALQAAGGEIQVVKYRWYTGGEKRWPGRFAGQLQSIGSTADGGRPVSFLVCP